MSEDALKRIRQRSKDEVYTDLWYCPECGLGEVESTDPEYEACERGDSVTCVECGHECCLEDILFIRGDILELLEEIDRLQPIATEAEKMLKQIAEMRDSAASGLASNYFERKKE